VIPKAPSFINSPLA
jgi:hypothetical protein